MKRLPLKKLSILGLVLWVVSAITAAILPNKNTLKTSKFVQLPSATVSSGAFAGLTCEITNTDPNATKETCDITNNSGTSGGVSGSSDGHFGNTTIV